MATTINDIANRLGRLDGAATVDERRASEGCHHPSLRKRMPRNVSARPGSGLAVAAIDGKPVFAVVRATSSMSALPLSGNMLQLVDGINSEVERAGARHATHIVAPDDIVDTNVGDDALPALLSTPNLAGIVILGPAQTSLVAQAARRVPVVTVSRRYDDTEADAVVADNVQATASLVEHLAALDHRRLAFVEDDRLDTFGDERYSGFLTGCARCGIDPLRQRRIKSDAYAWYGREGYIRREVLDAMLSYPRPTAFVCMNDRTAWKLLAACRRLGLNAPEQVSVTGFDYNPAPLADVLTDITLTTIDPNFAEMGRQAVRMLLQRIARPELPALRVVVPYRFIPGDTIGPPGL